MLSYNVILKKDYQSLTILIIFLFTFFIYLFSIFQRIINHEKFTYINLSFFTLFLYVLCISRIKLRDSNKLRILLNLFIIPTIGVTVTLVSIVITVLVFANDSIFINKKILENGIITIAEIHTGDWLFHQYTLIVYLIIIYLLKDSIYNDFHDFFLREKSIDIYDLNEKNELKTKIEIRSYYLILVSFPTLIIVLYMIIYDFMEQYPTDIPEVISYVLILLLILGLSSLYIYLFFVNPSKKNKFKNN